MVAHAGTLVVDIEGRIGKLDASLRTAERHVKQSQQRMDRDTKDFQLFGGNKLFLRFAAVGTAVSVINAASRNLQNTLERMTKTGEDFAEAWQQGASEALKAIPLIGAAWSLAEAAIILDPVGTSGGNAAALRERGQSARLQAMAQAGRDRLLAIANRGKQEALGSDSAGLRRQMEFEFRLFKNEMRDLVGMDPQLIAQATEAQGQAIAKEFSARIKAIEKEKERERDARHDAAVEAAMAETDARERALEHQMRIEKRMADQREEIIRDSNERLKELNEQSLEDSIQDRFRAAMQPFGFGGIGSFQSSFGLGVAKPPDFRKQKVEDERLRVTNDLLLQIRDNTSGGGATVQ